MLSFKEIQLLPEIFLGIPIIIIYLFNTQSNSALNIKSTSAFRRVMPLWRFATLHIPEDFSNYYNESSNNINAPFSDSAVVGKIVTIDPFGYFTLSTLYIVAPILPTDANNWSRERRIRYIQDLAYVLGDPRTRVTVSSLPHQLSFFNNYFNCLVTKNTTPLTENQVNVLKELKKKIFKKKRNGTYRIWTSNLRRDKSTL